MAIHNLENELELAILGSSVRILKIGGTDAILASDTTTPSGVSGYAPGCVYVDRTGAEILQNTGTSASCSFASIAAAAGSLDAAFDLGKEIDGATSLANAVQIGNGTDNIVLYYEGANDVRISTLHNAALTIMTHGTGDITIAPAGGGTAITGTLAVSGNVVLAGDLSITGTTTIGTVLMDSVTAATVATTLNLNGTDAGGVRLGHTSTGDIQLQRNTVIASGKNLTLTSGNAVLTSGNLTLTSGNATLTAGNLTLTDGNISMAKGKLEIDTTDDEGCYIKRNKAATTVALFELEETNTSADNPAFLIDHKPTGAVNAMEIDHDGTAAGLEITGTDAAGTQISLVGPASQTDSIAKLDGSTGSWIGADGVGMLNLVSDGNLAHANASCLLITYSGTGAATGLGTSIRVVDSGATATSKAVYVSAATGSALDIAHAGTVDCVTISSAAAAASAVKITTTAVNGTAIEALCVASTVTSMVVIDGSTGNWIGADGVGMVNLACDGALAHANASCLNIVYSGTGVATGMGTSLRIVDTGATATSYAVYVSVATGEALYVADGTSYFAKEVAIAATEKLNLDGVGGNSYIYENGGVLTAYSDGNIQITPAAGANGQVILGDLATPGETELHIKGDDDSDHDPGFIVLYDHTGADHFLWVDNTGDLRIHTSKPADQGVTGTVVGTQA